MLDLFKQDVRRWMLLEDPGGAGRVTLGAALRLMFFHMGLRAMFWFRLGSWLHRKHVPLARWLTAWIIFHRYGLEIATGAEIGGGMYIPHPVGSAIYARRIGKNCSVVANVTIGMRNRWEFPLIGDDVYIGAGARVLGGIAVGDGARIGANAVVIHDVPANTTVVGIPARPLGTGPGAAAGG